MPTYEQDPLQELVSKLQGKVKHPDIDGYKPLPHQTAFHTDMNGGRINFGGNRSGKTYSSVAEMIWWATGTHPYRQTPRPPLALRHVAVDKPQGIDKVLKELYRKLCPPRILFGGNFETAWHNTPPTLTFSNGSFIEFLTYEQDLDKHAGTSRHAIAFDEEPDEAIFNENMARLVDTDGSWWISMTPVEGLTWMYHRFWIPFEEGELEHVGVHVFLTDDNTFLPVGAFDRLLAGLSNEEKEARRTGKFVALSGLIFPFMQEIHVMKGDPQPLQGVLNITAMDHGLRHPTAWLWIQIDSDGILHVMKEHYQSELLIRDHARAVNIIEASAPLLRPAYRVGDPSIFNRNPESGQSIAAEYAQHGINIGAANNDVDAGIQRLMYLFIGDDKIGPYIRIHPSCKNLIKELRTYRWDEWANRKAEQSKEPKARPKKANDHATDALRYGAMSRPVFDTGKYLRPEQHGFAVDPSIKYAPVLGGPGTDYRNGAAYDECLGSEW